LQFCGLSFSSAKHEIQYFFTIYVLLQNIVDIVYITQNFQYHFSNDAHFADTVFRINTSVTVRPSTVQDE